MHGVEASTQNLQGFRSCFSPNLKVGIGRPLWEKLWATCIPNLISTELFRWVSFEHSQQISISTVIEGLPLFLHHVYKEYMLSPTLWYGRDLSFWISWPWPPTGSLLSVIPWLHTTLCFNSFLSANWLSSVHHNPGYGHKVWFRAHEYSTLWQPLQHGKAWLFSR